MRALYAERRHAFLEAVSDLPLKIDSQEAGIHCVGWLPEGMDDLELATRGEDNGLNLTPFSSFSIEPLSRIGSFLGYGGFSDKEIKGGALRLGGLLRSA